MHKDAKGNLIGRGEDATFAILSHPLREIERQVKTTKLITDPEEMEIMSAENKRRSIDLYFEEAGTKFCIRVNNGGKRSTFNKGNHISDGKSRIDKIQKRDLETYGYTVIDVNERDNPNIFKEKVNDDSIKELLFCFHGPLC